MLNKIITLPTLTKSQISNTSLINSTARSNSVSFKSNDQDYFLKTRDKRDLVEKLLSEYELELSDIIHLDQLLPAALKEDKLKQYKLTQQDKELILDKLSNFCEDGDIGSGLYANGTFKKLLKYYILQPDKDKFLDIKNSKVEEYLQKPISVDPDSSSITPYDVLKILDDIKKDTREKINVIEGKSDNYVFITKDKNEYLELEKGIDDSIKANLSDIIQKFDESIPAEYGEENSNIRMNIASKLIKMLPLTQANNYSNEQNQIFLSTRKTFIQEKDNTDNQDIIIQSLKKLSTKTDRTTSKKIIKFVKSLDKISKTQAKISPSTLYQNGLSLDKTDR